MPRGNEVLVYGGAIHFSKDQNPEKKENGQAIYGLIAEKKRKCGWGNSNFRLGCERNYHRNTALSMFLICFDRIEIGGFAYILPIPSCLTGKFMGKYLYIGRARNWRCLGI